MTRDALSLGIIGAGIMGERMLGVVSAQTDIPIRVAGIWDPSPASLDRIAGTFPAVTRMADADALIAASTCVYVASPPGSHIGYARRASAAGRSVFLEKPLAVDLEEARRFVAEGDAVGAVNFPFASSPAVATIARWIAEGAIGAPRRLVIDVAFAHWPRPWQTDAAAWLDARREGGFTREVVSHFLFLTRRLVGPLRELRGNANFPEPHRSERAIQAALRAGDVPVFVTGQVGGTRQDDHNTWTLLGESGAVRLRDWSIAERLRPNGHFETAPDALPNDQARLVALRRQLDGVVRMTRGEPHALATFVEALEVQEVVEGLVAR
jgi:predicted dehydrogenase